MNFVTCQPGTPVKVSGALDAVSAPVFPVPGIASNPFGPQLNLRHFRGRCFGKLAKHAEVARDLEVGHPLGKELGGSLRDWHLIGLVSGVGRQRNVAQVLNG